MMDVDGLLREIPASFEKEVSIFTKLLNSSFIPCENVSLVGYGFEFNFIFDEVVVCLGRIFSGRKIVCLGLFLVFVLFDWQRDVNLLLPDNFGTSSFQKAHVCSFLSIVIDTGSHIMFPPRLWLPNESRWAPCIFKTWRFFSVNLGHPTVPPNVVPTGLLWI